MVCSLTHKRKTAQLSISGHADWLEGLINYSCGLSKVTIDYSSLFVCVCVCLSLSNFSRITTTQTA